MLSRSLIDLSQLYCFIEIVPNDDVGWANSSTSIMSKEYELLINKKFKTVLLTEKHDIWPAFKRIFGGVIDE